MDKVNLPPNPSKLMEGLRDTGYDFNTALADIVDNSVDAGATKIDIYIKMDGDGDKFIMVADNGCGMDEETRNKIFDPFFTTKDVGEGTGLGLYIVYSEIQKMNGEIYVESEPKKGTTIYLSIDIGGNHV